MTQDRAIETRQRILNTALDLFSSTGYERTSIADICSASGLSKGAVYHHFSSKQEIFLALLNDWIQDLSQSLIPQTSQLLPADLQIFQMAKEMPSIYSAARGKYFIILEFWLQASRDPDIWDAAVSPYRIFESAFTRLIQTGINQGVFSPALNPGQASRTLISLALGYLLQAFLVPDGNNWGDESLAGIQSLITSWK